MSDDLQDCILQLREEIADLKADLNEKDKEIHALECQLWALPGGSDW